MLSNKFMFRASADKIKMLLCPLYWKEIFLHTKTINFTFQSLRRELAFVPFVM